MSEKVTVELTLVEASLLMLSADITARVGYYIGPDGEPHRFTDKGTADLNAARQVLSDAVLPALREKYPELAAKAIVRAQSTQQHDTVRDVREPNPTGLYL